MLAHGLEDAGFEPHVRTNGNQQFFWFDPDDAVRIVKACGAGGHIRCGSRGP
ncbi:MAG: hypothetical protein ACLTSX_06320 [Collinsella sp.]